LLWYFTTSFMKILF